MRCTSPSTAALWPGHLHLRAKVPVGLGNTENKTVVSQLLADLVDRGLWVEAELLVVIDGAKALAGGVRRVFGDQVLVQLCR